MKSKFVLFKIGVLVIISAVFIKYSVPKYIAFFQSNIPQANVSKPYLGLYYKSKQLLADGKKEEALKVAKEAVQLKPKEGKVYLQLGYAHFKLKNFDEAEKYYKISLQHPMKQVNQAIAHNNLGVIYHQNFSFYDKAIEHYKKSFELLPKNENLRIDPLDGLVEVLVYNNQVELAKQWIEKHDCKTQYCQWLNGVEKLPEYPPISQEKLITMSRSFGGRRTEGQKKKDGGLHGFLRTYYEDGTLMMDEYYKDRKLDGIQKVYYEDGNLSYERIYNEGKLLGKNMLPLNGKATVLHKSGELAEESSYVDGLQSGLTKMYSEDKTLISEILYKEGQFKKAKRYYETGELQTEMDFEIQDGVYRTTYYESGKIKIEHIREKGKVISEKFYDEKGNYLGDGRHPEIDSIEIVKAGIFKQIKQSKDYPKNICFLKSPQFNPKLIHATDSLNAELNAKFGIAYKVHGTPDEGKAKLTVKFIHPPMTNPKTGKTTTIEEFKIYPKINEIDVVAWIFEEKWEMVSGEWTIQLFIEDKKLAEQVFVVKDSIQMLKGIPGTQYLIENN